MTAHTISAETNEYIDLFSQDMSNHRDTLQNDLKQYFESRLNNNLVPRNDNIQNKMINPWTSYSMYENLRLGNRWKKERQAINNLYRKHKNQLDNHQKEFLTKFPGAFWHLTFELAIAFLLSKKFSLKVKVICNNQREISQPDLEFHYNNQGYFAECTTACSSLLDKLDKLLPEFEKYYHIAQIFSEKSRARPWYFKSNIEQFCRMLLHEEKEYIEKLLNINIDEVPTCIDNWMSLNRYACTYFKEIIPDIIQEKLKSLLIPEGTFGEIYDVNFFVKNVALKLVEKLEKPYFQNNNAGIIAVSLAMLPQDAISFLALPSSIKNGDFFDEKTVKVLNNELNRLIKIKEKVDQEKILIGLKNLYAIIIDTTCHNWFPDSENHQNHYGVLYNKNYINYSENFIFNDIISYSSVVQLLSEIF